MNATRSRHWFVALALVVAAIGGVAIVALTFIDAGDSTSGPLVVPALAEDRDHGASESNGASSDSEVLWFGARPRRDKGRGGPPEKSAVVRTVNAPIRSSDSRGGSDGTRGDSVETQRVLEVLRTKRLAMTFDDTPLSDVLSYLQSISNLNMLMTADVRTGADEELINLNIGEVELGKGLALVLEVALDMDLEYWVDDGVVWVGTTVEEQRWRERRHDSRHVRDMISQYVFDMRFMDRPLSRVISGFRREVGIRIQPTETVASQWGGLKVSLVAPNYNIQAALGAILPQFELAYWIDNGVVWIGTDEEKKRWRAEQDD